MSQIETITEPETGVERRLGCVVPMVFPTGFTGFADAFPNEMLTWASIKSALAGRPSMWGRRRIFAGKKYIREQHELGSCNGWAVAGRLARLRELRGEPYVCLSGSDAYSQMNGGRDQGSILADGVKVLEVGGIAPEDMVPYNQIYTHQISAEAKAARSRFKGFKSYAVDTELELASALVLGRVAVVAVHVPNGTAFMKQDGDGINLAGNGHGNHSVGVDDLRLGAHGNLNYDMGNSWGTGYCEGGYTWLTWDRHLRETVKFHRFFVLVSTTDDPADDSTQPKVKG